jgi:hypothetical protein
MAPDPDVILSEAKEMQFVLQCRSLDVRDQRERTHKTRRRRNCPDGDSYCGG